MHSGDRKSPVFFLSLAAKKAPDGGKRKSKAKSLLKRGIAVSLLPFGVVSRKGQ